MNRSKLLLSSTMAALMFMSQQALAFKVGLAMPTQNEDRWYNEGVMLKNKLLSAGFEVDLFYGGDVDIALQQRQIIRLANEGVNALVIGAIDGAALSDSLSVVKSRGIPVISYDRLITGTDAVSYYATFDNEMVGHIQGSYIVNRLNLNSDSSTKYVELFYGSLNDNNAKFFWRGAMQELEPYIRSGQLVVKSKELTPEKVNVPDWSEDEANKRMTALMESQGYGPGKNRLDAILSPADCISAGVIFALKREGYDSNSIPVITGQDATELALKQIQDGDLSMTIYKDPYALCDTIVKMVTSISKHEEVEVNDTSTYDNGVKVVATYLCKPELIDKHNLNKVR